MPSNSEIILSQQVHPGDSTPTTVTGDNFKGDGYYGRSDGFHTVQYNLLSFIGTISIEATLAINPQSEDWFTVHTQQFLYDSNTDQGVTANKIVNFTGNYVWVRAIVSDWTDGTVKSIMLNH